MALNWPGPAVMVGSPNRLRWVRTEQRPRGGVDSPVASPRRIGLREDMLSNELVGDPARDRPLCGRPAEIGGSLAAHAAVRAQREHRHVSAPGCDRFLGGPGSSGASAGDLDDRDQRNSA
jgi:hypothetical protein